MSSLSAAIRAEDYLDPFWVSGTSFRVSHLSPGGGTFDLGFGIERHANASRVVSDAPLGTSGSFRAVRAIDEGEFFTGSLAMSRTLTGPAGARGFGRLETKLLEGQPGGGIGITGEIDERWGPLSRASELRIHAVGWAWAGDALPQGHRLIGGRETLPGYRFREFAGTRAVVASLVGSTVVGGSLLSLRGGLHAGWAQDADPTVAASWGTRGTGGIRGAASVGIGLGWDLLHLDLARGWEGGEWQLLLSVDRDWWDWL
jgi:hypothetical protein